MTSWAPAVFLLGVLMGSGSAVSTKVLYGISSTGIDGEVRLFEKPLVLTWVMFLSMTLALPLHWIQHHRSKAAEQKARLGLGHNVNNQTTTRFTMETGASWRTLFLLLVPTVFDLMATALGAIGLIFISVSVYQLIRCSVMIMTAILKLLIFRDGTKMHMHMWIGLTINTIATCMASVVSVAPEHAESQPGDVKDPRWGIFFTLLSCVVQASQYVFEEKLMTEESAGPLLVVGMEGVWGSLLMPLIVFPWATILPGSDVGGMIENLHDALVMIKSSTTLQIMLIVYFLFVFGYNIFAIYVTFLLSSIWHAILENFRPMAVWIIGLALYYVITAGRFGEKWTGWSFMELAGMIAMMFGTAVYDGQIRLSFLHYPADAPTPSTAPLAADPEAQSALSTPKLISSPLLTRNVARAQRLSSFSKISNLAGPVLHGRSASGSYYDTGADADGDEEADHRRPPLDPREADVDVHTHLLQTGLGFQQAADHHQDIDRSAYGSTTRNGRAGSGAGAGASPDFNHLLTPQQRATAAGNEEMQQLNLGAASSGGQSHQPNGRSKKK